MESLNSTRHTLAVMFTSFVKEDEAKCFAEQFGFSFIDDIQLEAKSESKVKRVKSRNSKNKIKHDFFRIVFSLSRTSLFGPEAGEIFVDFVEGELAHRRKFGGGKGQMIAKAIGLNKGYVPSVLDATAGLGSDAFVLACLGCDVTMMERSPIAYVLLSDGLIRAKEFATVSKDHDLLEIINRMALLKGNSLGMLDCDSLALCNVSDPDVVYLDPMFPVRKKSAEVKKAMKAFHDLIGDDSDANDLLDKAIDLAKYRVVVKRPKIAPYLAAKEPNYQLSGKSSRFDIYTKQSFPKS